MARGVNHPAEIRFDLRRSWVDLLVLTSILGAIWIALLLGGDMRARFDELHPPELSLDPSLLPYYASRTILRMFLAFVFSLLFTVVFGYIAAKSPAARRVMLPALDVLQSVPILGFLSITVTGFIGLFPGSLLGVECASIFAIFTSQAWNMTFGFYHSMITVPTELQEAASVYQMSRWQRLTKVELPFSAIGLTWNSMMAFGGGWFFVAQSEAITVLNKNIKLPGLGSYMATAVEQGNMRCALYAIATMILTIVIIDQFVWRPLVAWAEKFKMEQTESGITQTSWALDLLQSSFLVHWIAKNILGPTIRRLQNLTHGRGERFETAERLARLHKLLGKPLEIFVFTALIAASVYYGVEFLRAIRTELSVPEMLRIAGLAGLTFLRVLAMVILASLIWVPIGVWIGSRPGVARFAQPIAQIAASFPVNMTFPFVVALFIALSIPMNFGSILLIALGTQWYILFNIIAVAMTIPTDLKEAAGIFQLRGLRKWKTLIIPAIFPFWVTGAVTAAGGAWNASIVAEVATWGNDKLVADGLGAYIASATTRGDQPAIYFSIAVMSLIVVIVDKLVWRNLYNLAEKRFRLE